MKLLIVLSLVAVALAAPPQSTYDYNNYNPQLLRYENDNNGLGDYKYFYEQSDGAVQVQQGELRNEGTDDAFVAVKGAYSFIAPNGIRYTVIYTADEDGYKPEIEEGPGGPPPAVVASLLG